MRTQTLVILPKIDYYRILGSNDAWYMKKNIIELINQEVGGVDKATFVLQDELALELFGKECDNWISLLSSMDDIILNRIASMPGIYYDRLKISEKVDKRLLLDISKVIKYPKQDKAYDAQHHSRLSLQTIRQRIGKVLETVYTTFDLVIYISRGKSFMRPPKIEMGRESLIIIYDMREDIKRYYYSGVEVDYDIFKKIKRGAI